MRTTPLSDVTKEHFDCFPPEQQEKTLSMEPAGLGHAKCNIGAIIDTADKWPGFGTAIK